MYDSFSLKYYDDERILDKVAYKQQFVDLYGELIADRELECKQLSLIHI